jgi:hypothetical protein
MMPLQVHTTKEIRFESEEGELDISIDERGLTLRTFRTEAGMHGPATSKLLPTSMAMEMRDFLIYALADHGAKETP